MDRAGLNFLHYANAPQCRSNLTKYFKGYFSLQLMTEGTVSLAYDDILYTLKGKWFWAFYPGPRITMRASDGTWSWHHRYVAFTGDVAFRWWEEGLIPTMPIATDNDWELQTQRFDTLLSLLQQESYRAHRRAINVLEGIFLDLIDRHNSQTANQNQRWCQRVVSLLQNSPIDRPDYSEIARILGIHVRTLRDRFKQLMGVSLHRFTIERRIAEAKRLLTDTRLPIKEIAERLRYNDIHFFTKQFHTYTQMTPAAFRQSFQLHNH